MKLYMSRRERREQDDRNFIEHFAYLTMERHHSRCQRREHALRARRWLTDTPPLPDDTEVGQP